MKLIIPFVILVMGCSTMNRPINETKIFNMGSLHGYMLNHPKYNLNIFIDAIYQFKPDVIFTEVRQQYPGVIDGSIDGGIEQSIIYAIGELENIEIVPIDWFDDSFISLMKEESKRASNDNLVKEVISPIYKEYEEMFKTESFTTLNGNDARKLIKREYDLYDQYGYKASKIRNENICNNLKAKLSKYTGKKILTIFGLDHKYFLDDCNKNESLKVLNTGEWYQADKITSIDSKLIKVSLENLKKSKLTLQERIKENYYPNDYSRKVSKKIKSFDKWIKAVKDLSKP